MKKNEQVYDNIKHKTPMKRMLEAQEARRKLLAEAEAESETKPKRKTTSTTTK